MTMLDIHSAAIASGNVAYHEFLLCYKANSKTVYGLVEGNEDPCFYRNIIDNMLPGEWNVHLIRAGNKEKVLKVFDDMDWSRFHKNRICFFVDRDLSMFLGGETHSGENLYITDKYSIECDVVSVGTFERSLEELLNITKLSMPEKDAINTVFEQNLHLFCDSLAPVMAQIILWKRAGSRVSLDNIDMRQLFDFTDGMINLKAGYSSPSDLIQHAATCVAAPASSASDIALAESEFRSSNGPVKFTRGKYLMWFFVQCLKEVHKAISKFCAAYSEPPKVRIELGRANAMTVIAPRSRFPESLKCFIERNYCTYIRSAASI